MGKQDRDIEKAYSNAEFAEKLRRLADCVEAGENFEIQVAGERIYVHHFVNRRLMRRCAKRMAEMQHQAVYEGNTK